MNILVIGATGGSGRAACDALLDRGHRVTALARHATGLPARAGTASGPTATRRTPPASTASMPGHDAVVITLGISESALRVRLRGAQRTPDDVRSRGTIAVAAAAAARESGASSCSRPTASARPGHCSGSSIARLRTADQAADRSTPSCRRRALRGSGLDWTIVQPVYLSDDASDEHFASLDGSHPRAEGLPSRRRAASTQIWSSGPTCPQHRDRVRLIPGPAATTRGADAAPSIRPSVGRGCQLRVSPRR